VAAKEIRLKFDGWVSLTQTLLSLANAAARQSTLISNTTLRWGALLTYRIKSGAAAPTVGTIYELFLLKGNGTVRTDNAGASDAAITIQNAQLFGTLQVTATANANFTDVFDTAPLGKLGPEWGTAVRNSSGQALSAGAETDFVKQYNAYVPELQ
jgi:hypothetical protein